jgi:hypothetical protein
MGDKTLVQMTKDEAILDLRFKNRTDLEKEIDNPKVLNNDMPLIVGVSLGGSLLLLVILLIFAGRRRRSIQDEEINLDMDEEMSFASDKLSVGNDLHYSISSQRSIVSDSDRSLEEMVGSTNQQLRPSSKKYPFTAINTDQSQPITEVVKRYGRKSNGSDGNVWNPYFYDFDDSKQPSVKHENHSQPDTLSDVLYRSEKNERFVIDGNSPGSVTGVLRLHRSDLVVANTDCSSNDEPCDDDTMKSKASLSGDRQRLSKDERTSDHDDHRSNNLDIQLDGTYRSQINERFVMVGNSSGTVTGVLRLHRSELEYANTDCCRNDEPCDDDTIMSKARPLDDRQRPSQAERTYDHDDHRNDLMEQKEVRQTTGSTMISPISSTLSYRTNVYQFNNESGKIGVLRLQADRESVSSEEYTNTDLLLESHNTHDRITLQSKKHGEFLPTADIQWTAPESATDSKQTRSNLSTPSKGEKEIFPQDSGESPPEEFNVGSTKMIDLDFSSLRWNRTPKNDDESEIQTLQSLDDKRSRDDHKRRSHSSLRLSSLPSEVDDDGVKSISQVSLGSVTVNSRKSHFNDLMSELDLFHIGETKKSKK